MNDYLEKEWALSLQNEVLEKVFTLIFKENNIDFNLYKEDAVLGYGNFF